MNFEQVPAELRALRQWTVWRPVLRRLADGVTKVTKPPYRPDDPSIPAANNDPGTWGTFEQAVACYLANSSVIGGIGFMLTQADPYTVFDLDDRSRVQPNMQGYRDEFEKHVLSLGSYTEYSPSDKGLHVWVYGQMGGQAGRHLQGVNAEAYCHTSFITVTGRPVTAQHAGAILNGQDFINMVGLGERPPEERIADDTSKPCDLSDQEVLNRAASYVSHFADRWQGRVGCDPGEWSHTFVSVVGVLDRITGSVDQLYRLVLGSPMVCGAHVSPAGSGEGRPAKARRTFADVLGRVRRSNRGERYWVDHGRSIWESICAERERVAIETAERVRKRMAESEADLSRTAAKLLDLFPELDTYHRELSYPPGVGGEFVRATEAATHAPFTKFAIPAALAALSGVIGRQYKTAAGGGLNLNFILAAPSSTGKTETMRAWEKFMSQVLATMPATRAGPPKSRIINTSAASIQGIAQDFQDTPSCAWFNEECKSQLDSMSNCKTNSESALRDSYNRLYDCSKAGAEFSVPRSVASRNSGIAPIVNLSVSTYWTTTTSKFDATGDDALDGFLSRVVVIRHKGPAGKLKRESAELPVHLADRLRDLMNFAQSLDDSYALATPGGAPALSSVEAKLVRVDSSLVHALDWQLVEQCEAIKNASLSGTLPATYTAASRLPQTAMRIASTLAVLENPYHPTVTEVQLKWAFGYALQNTVSLLSDMDAGEVGHAASDEVVAFVRCYRDLARKPEYVGLPGVPRNDLFQQLKSVKPCTTSPIGRSKAATSVLGLMLSEGLADEITQSTGQRGRPTRYFVPVLSHRAWA